MIVQLGQLLVDGEVRIIDGTDTCGRLEVFAFGGWQSVCSDGFDDIDATVACIDMGFGYVQRIPHTCVYNHYDDETRNSNKTTST